MALARIPATDPQHPSDVAAFIAGLSGSVIRPEDAEYETARQVHNATVDKRPALIVQAANAGDVARTIVFAREVGLELAVRGGSHSLAGHGTSEGGIVLDLGGMKGLHIDPERRLAWAQPGLRAEEYTVAAAAHGLATPFGDTGSVGIAGLTLGGGIGWLVRRHGLTIDALVSVEIVTADGRLLTASATEHPDLFWAVRGGGGNVGAVTALEIGLFPITTIVAGALFWPIERATEILAAWRAWIDSVPDACTSLGRMLQLPDAPFLPDHLRGRSFVLVEAAILGSEADAAALLRPLRDLDPAFDTIVPMPAADLSVVNMDPEAPVPYAGDGALLTDMPREAIDRLVERFVGSPLLHVEVRHLGGAAAVSSPDHGALDAIEQPFVAFTFGLVTDPGPDLATVDRAVDDVLDALRPWDSGRRYLNFADRPTDPRSIFAPAAYERLQRTKAQVDPTGMFVANHSVATGSGDSA
jgi:FAD/FMN-containing dehydrogenase